MAKRPKLTPAVKARICREVALGKSLRSTLKAKGMPSMKHVMEVLHDDPSWSEQYARARRVGIELHIDGILDLADTATGENAQAVRLRVDTRKWLASKLVPKVYGDRLELQGELNVNARTGLAGKPFAEWTHDQKLDRLRELVFDMAMIGREVRDVFGLENLAEGYGYLGDQTWRQGVDLVQGRRKPAAPAGLLPAPPVAKPAQPEPREEREINPAPPKPDQAPAPGFVPSRDEQGLG